MEEEKTNWLQSFVKKHPYWFCWAAFGILMVFRAIDFFVLRLDDTEWLGYTTIHEVIGVILLALILWQLKWTWASIGMINKKWWKHLGIGLLLGGVTLAIALVVEMISVAGQSPQLMFFMGTLSGSPEVVVRTGLWIVLSGLIFNVVVVITEEGFFRGLFRQVLKGANFWKAALFASFLFGLWHTPAAILAGIDGTLDWMSAVSFMFGYTVFGLVVGTTYSILYAMTGSILVSVAHHWIVNMCLLMVHIVVDNTEPGITNRSIITNVLTALAVVGVYFLWYKRTKRPNLDVAAPVEAAPTETVPVEVASGGAGTPELAGEVQAEPANT